MSETETALQRKAKDEKILQKMVESGQMVEFKVTLSKTHVDFLKEYLEYHGGKQAIETVFMMMIYNEISRVFREETPCSNQWKSFIQPEEWNDKHPHLSIVCSLDPEEEEDD